MQGVSDKHFIEFINVSKSFGEIIALENITFAVEKGEFVFITGHSGAGKTTLLRLITRELTAGSGKILFDGTDIASLPGKEIPTLRQKIGVVFQDYKLITEKTARENIEMPLAVIGVAQSEWKARVDQVLKLVNLTLRSELFPSQLSGGELQRVAIARALVVNPKLILADEPTGNLDWNTSESIIDLLVRINKEGKTLLVATHNQMLIDKVKVRVVELADGKVAKDIKLQSDHISEPGVDKKSRMKVRVEEV